MTERMGSYDVIIPRVLMQVQPCPQFVVLDAVQQAAVDFFTRTEVWTDTMAETLFRGSRVMELTADRGVVVSRVLHLLLDGVRLEGGSDFHAERAGSGITVLFHAAHEDADHTVYACCAFRPARTAAQVPEALLEEWGDTLVFGSLAKIKSMSGPRVGWSDPQAAQMNLSLYEQGVAQARIRGARRWDGRRLTARPQRGDL